MQKLIPRVSSFELYYSIQDESQRRVSFSETTIIREANDQEDESGIRKFSASSGDEAFEKLELRRRLTIVHPTGTFLGDDQDDENLDIAYDDELIYDDEDNDLEREEFYEKYSDEDQEDLSEIIDDPLVDEDLEDDLPTPQTFEELNALYKPQFEEKLTTIESRFQAPKVEMLSPKQSTPNRASPQPPSNLNLARERSPVITPPVVPEKRPSPLVTRKSSPIPSEIKEIVPTTSSTTAPAPIDDDYDDEEEYSDELYEEETEGSDVDDDDLMRRLEAKYGKLPEHLVAEEEAAEEDYSGQSDLDDDDPSWTSKVK